MGNNNSTVLFVIAMVLLAALAVGVQFFRTRRSPLGRVLRIFSNVKYDEKFCQDFNYSRSIGKFRTGAWEKTKEKVGFLPEDLRAELGRLFGIIADVNDRIEAAIHLKSNGYLAGIDVSKLQDPLAACREQLQKWISANMHNPEYLPKRRSLFRW